MQLKNTKPAILLIDCNNFFVSCEQVFNPKLKGKPVLVLSNNDGCIVSRSQETKKLGIPMGAPLHKVQDLVKRHNVHTFSANFRLYGDMSHRIMRILRSIAPSVEVYSIDEAFLTHSSSNTQVLHTYAHYIKKLLYQHTGIPVSIGIGPTKTLAKVANYWAKSHPETQGVAIGSPDLYWLNQIPVGEVWGIGPQTSLKFNQKGIYNAGQCITLDDIWIRKNFGILGLRTIYEMRGFSCSHVVPNQALPQTLQSTRSFGKPIQDFHSLREAVASYTAQAAQRLRTHKGAAMRLTVYIRTNPHSAHEEYYKAAQSVALSAPTDTTPTLLQYAYAIVKNLYKPGKRYKKAGVILSEIVPRTALQQNLLYKTSHPQHTRLMSLIDTLNEKMGGNTIHYAAEGFKRQWSMKQEHKSKQFTTRWEDILTIR